MSIERVGQCIEFMVPGDNGGTRTLARINAIQLVSETDCIGNKVLITAAGKTFRIGATLDQVKEILVDPASRTWAWTDSESPAPAQQRAIMRGSAI